MSAIMPTYGSPSLAFERGHGVYLYDTDGKQYLDFCTGIAVMGGKMLASSITERQVSVSGGILFFLFGFYSMYVGPPDETGGHGGMRVLLQ